MNEHQYPALWWPSQNIKVSCKGDFYFLPEKEKRNKLEMSFNQYERKSFIQEHGLVDQSQTSWENTGSSPWNILPGKILKRNTICRRSVCKYTISETACYICGAGFEAPYWRHHQLLQLLLLPACLLFCTCYTALQLFCSCQFSDQILLFLMVLCSAQCAPTLHWLLFVMRQVSFPSQYKPFFLQ